MIIREIDEGHCGGMGREPFCVHGEWGDGDGNGNRIRNSNLLTCGSEYNYEDEGPIGYGRKRPKKENYFPSSRLSTPQTSRQFASDIVGLLVPASHHHQRGNPS